MPDPAHPLPEWELKVIHEDFMRREAAAQDQLPRGKGWSGIGFAELDGQSWTLDFAAKLLDIPERDLRDMVRITRLQPCGVLNLRSYRSQGRAPRAYPAKALIRIAEAVEDLKFPDSPDSV